MCKRPIPRSPAFGAGEGPHPQGVLEVIVGQHGPAVVLSAETAYYLETICKVSGLRQRLRDGRHQQVSQELLDLRRVAMAFDPSALPQGPDIDGASADMASKSDVDGLSVAEVADQLGVTSRHVRRACKAGDLAAELVGTKPTWLITQRALDDWKSRRSL